MKLDHYQIIIRQYLVKYQSENQTDIRDILDKIRHKLVKTKINQLAPENNIISKKLDKYQTKLVRISQKQYQYNIR